MPWSLVRGARGRLRGVGAGRFCVFPVSSLPALRFPRCVWQAVPSGCPLSSLAGTPFQAVCAFRGLRLVAFLVFPACPLRVRALALSRRPRPPPPWVVVARAPRAVLVLGADRGFSRSLCPSACPASVPCSVWLAWGGGWVARSRSPPPLLGVVCPPLGTPSGALESLLCALWAQHEGARVGRLLPWCGASGVGRSPTPDDSSFGACGRGPLPTGSECGGCGCGDPSPTPQRALLRAGFVRCGGSTRAPGGGASCLCVERLGLSPLTPDHSSFGACCRGRLPTGCGSGARRRGDLSPTPQRALLRAGIARYQGSTRAPRVGAPCLGVGHPGSGAPQPPTARSLRACGRGQLPTGCGCGRCRLGDPLSNHSSRELALRAVGEAQERSRGAPLASLWGVRGWALSYPRPLVLWNVRPGPTTHWRWVRVVRAWIPVSKPTTRALASWLCALWGRHEGAWGRRPCLVVGLPESGTLPPPTARPLGRAGRAHYPLAVGAEDAGVGSRHQPHSVGSCELALRAVGAAQGCPWGPPLAWVWGVLDRVLSQPRPLVLWGLLPRPTTHWLWVRGVRAWGPVTNPTARALASWLCAL